MDDDNNVVIYDSDNETIQYSEKADARKSVQVPDRTSDGGTGGGIYLSLPSNSNLATQKLYANLIQIKDKINEDETNMIFVAHRYAQTGSIPWKIMSKRAKFVYISAIIIRILGFLLSLYIFIVTLDLMTSSFTLLSRSVFGKAFKSQFLLQNPIASVMFSLIITTILQSSSTVTSIIVSMVGSGVINDVRVVIPMIMGANIGTSITNTLVSFSQVASRDEFSRSFSSGILMDVFNYLTTLILLPLEVIIDRLTPNIDMFHHGGYLARVSGAIASLIQVRKGTDVQLLKAITKPLTQAIIQVDEYAITSNNTNITVGKIMCGQGIKCKYLFRSLIEKTGDNIAGTILFICSLLLLVFILLLMVKLLRSMIIGVIDDALKKILHIQHKGWRGYLLGYLFIVVGIIGTMMVQSSSVFCSILTPLVGLKVLALERNYELTIGANIGTTVTALLASLTQAGKFFRQSVQIALCHFLFNFSGMLLWYCIPYLRRIPLTASRIIGKTVAKHRWFAIFYVLLIFLLFPLLLLALALIHWIAAVVFIFIILLLFITVIIINHMQKSKSKKLPIILQTWTFLPESMHSLNIWDKRLEKLTDRLCCQCCIKCLYPPSVEEDTELLKNQYLSYKESYISALDHRFLTHTHQLNNVFEQHHAPILHVHDSLYPVTSYVQDLYRSLTGKAISDRRTLKQLNFQPLPSPISVISPTTDDIDELVDTVVYFDRKRNRKHIQLPDDDKNRKFITPKSSTNKL
ncbi:unnamed protein product [Didymodactylos carnosus]|uniref:Uncharacterized protein n=1 Tax=Didymodactylos carnosus TaxID=1234261 RepID=A0A8S2SQQ9_9BILA|nr:unnamed protein product [Didymodactylos carnosus]CAF4215122.1 unnamed protein product [Didymodactylos carnosus]